MASSLVSHDAAALAPTTPDLEALYGTYGQRCFALAHRILGKRDSAMQVLEAAFRAIALQPLADDTDIGLRLVTLTHLLSVRRLRESSDQGRETTQPDLRHLTKLQSNIVSLAYFGGLTIQAIATRLDLSVVEVRRELAAGIRRLALDPNATETG